MIKILLKTQNDLWLTFGLTYDIKIFDIQSFHESGLTLAYPSKFMNYFNLKDFFFQSALLTLLELQPTIFPCGTSFSLTAIYPSPYLQLCSIPL